MLFIQVLMTILSFLWIELYLYFKERFLSSDIQFYACLSVWNASGIINCCNKESTRRRFLWRKVAVWRQLFFVGGCANCFSAFLALLGNWYIIITWKIGVVLLFVGQWIMDLYLNRFYTNCTLAYIFIHTINTKFLYFRILAGFLFGWIFWRTRNKYLS